MWILRLSWHANGDGGGIFINGHIHILRDLHLELNGAKHDLVSKEGEEEDERREDQSKEMTDWLWPNGDQASDKKRSNVNHVTNMANRNHGATKSFCTDCQLIAPFRPSHPLPTSWAAVRAVLLFGSNSCLVIGSKASLPPQSIHTVHRVSQTVSVCPLKSATRSRRRRSLLWLLLALIWINWLHSAKHNIHNAAEKKREGSVS